MNRREALENLVAAEEAKTLDGIDNIVKEAASVGGYMKAMTAPVVGALALWGTAEGIDAIRDKIKANKLKQDLNNSFDKVIANNPDLEAASGGKESLREMFDVYGDLAPNFAKHPLVIANLLRETGASGLTSMNPDMLKTITGIEGNIIQSQSQRKEPNELVRSLMPGAPTIRMNAE